MAQFRPIEPRTWRLPGGAVAQYVIQEGHVSAVFCSGAVGNGFLSREDFIGGVFTNAELIDKGAVPWQTNKWVPLTFDRLVVIVNALTTLNGIPHLLIYTRSIPWPVT